MEDKHQNTRSDAHNKPEICVLWVMVGSLSDGGMASPALFVFDDAHIVGITGGQDDYRKVEDDDPV